MVLRHGIELKEYTEGSFPLIEVETSVIAVVGTASKGEQNTPILIKGLDEAIEVFGDMPLKAVNQFTLVKSISAIYKQVNSSPIIIAVSIGTGHAFKDELSLHEDDKVLAVGNEAEQKGIYALLRSKSLLGIKPNIIIAPLLSSDYRVAEALHKVAIKLRALSILDRIKSEKPADNIEYRFKNAANNSRLEVVYPALIMSEEGLVGYSAVWAGVRARTDDENGFWVSASNRQIRGLEKPTVFVDFNVGEEGEADTLNQANVTTLIREGSWRIWGSRTLADGDDTAFSFDVARRTADAINETIVKNTFFAIDAAVSDAFVVEVTERVNDYLRDLKSRGGIYGGKCWFDKKKNPASNIRDGKITFTYDFSSIAVAEKITLESIITDRYIKEVFG